MMNENELKAAIEAKAKELEELKEMMASLVNEQQKKRDELKKKAELINELKQNYEKLKAEYVTEKTAYMKKDKEYNELKEKVEPQLVEVITDVFRKVTGVVAEDNQQIILHLINDVMHNADGSRDYVIKVSPEDYKFLVNNQGKIYCAMSREVNIDIVEDTGLERNQCMIETNTGIFNCSLDIELNNLIKNIKLLSCV